MTRLKVVWGQPAIQALRSLPRRDAERVDAAILRYAETGSGDVRALPGDNPFLRRLRVDGYRVRMVLDPNAGSLWIVMVYRADR